MSSYGKVYYGKKYGALFQHPNTLPFDNLPMALLSPPQFPAASGRPRCVRLRQWDYWAGSIG